MRTDEAMAVERLHTELTAQIAKLRAALTTIAEHSSIHSDFPHSLKNIQAYARSILDEQP